MIEFLIGRACTGKTYQTVSKVVDASKSSKTILIVPEQFTFETERAVIKFDDAVQDNISVLSFSRLYDAIVEQSGRGGAACVTDFEKLILLKKALKVCADDLKVFSKYVGYHDFISNLNSVIRDLKFAGIDSKDIADAAESIGGFCGAKLKDISLVMSTYEALFTDKFIDPSDRLTKVYSMLENNDFFAECNVFFDSFTGFTGQQYKVIQRIIEKASDITFSFCTSSPDDTSLGVFHNINFTIGRIKSIAASRGIADFKQTLLERHFYSNSSMLALENLMSGEKIENTESLKNINIVSCDNRRDEAVAAANIIASEVAENGYRFKDFVLVARNAGDYAAYIKRQCDANKVACFMDESVTLTQTPLGIYILTLLEISRSLTTDNILKLLKLRLSGFTDEEISEIENYTFVWDLKGADWRREWELSVNGMQTGDDNEFDILRLRKINETREKVIGILDLFKNKFAGTPYERAKAVYTHLVDNKVDKHLSALCDCFEAEGDLSTASVIKQSWDCVVGVLDCMVRVLDKTDISSDEFIESLLVAAESADISNIPQMLDEVTFGSADKIRPSKPKICIILGANQGVFPKITKSSGLLAAADIEKLNSIGIYLNDDAVKGAVEENYLVYSMLSCPVDKVYVLYSKRTVSGEELEPSSFVFQLLKHFSDLTVEHFSLSSSGKYMPRTTKVAFGEIGGVDRASFEDIKESLKGFTEYSDKIEKILSATADSSFDISKQSSAKLFGDELRVSATKFDTYHKCSLSYLLKNGLRIKTLQRADLNVLQRGTIAHYVLENIISKHGKSLCELSAIQISAEVDSLINEYISAVKGSEMLMTARFAYLLQKISASVKIIVSHIAEEFSQSGFEPKFFELSIGRDGDIPQMEYTLSDDSRLCVEGKIDRVDVYKNNVRIVDYKTGKMSFVLSNTLVGLNMQMLLYLYAFIKNGKELVEDAQPAGILYMPAKGVKDKKSLKMSGLISDDESIRLAMEPDNNGRYIPKYSEKATEYVSGDLFGLVFNKIDQLLLNMGERIRKGEFCADPTDGISINACAYCDFASICRSDKKEHKCAIPLSNEEIREALKGGDTNGI